MPGKQNWIVLFISLVPCSCFASGHLPPSPAEIIVEILIYPFVFLSVVINILGFVKARFSYRRFLTATIISALIIDIIWMGICVIELKSCYDYFKDFSHWYLENLPPGQVNSLNLEHRLATQEMWWSMVLLGICVSCFIYNLILIRRVNTRREV